MLFTSDNLPHKIHCTISIDPVVATWGLNNLKPSMSGAIENFIRGRMGLSIIGSEQIIKTKEGVIKKIADNMISYSKEDKRDSTLKDQLNNMAEGLEFIFLNDFAKKITIEQARKLLIKELKKRGFKVGN